MQADNQFDQMGTFGAFEDPKSNSIIGFSDEDDGFGDFDGAQPTLEANDDEDGFGNFD